MHPSDEAEGPFLTLTHARLLIHQGDLGSAVRVLRRLIRERPHDEAARRLLQGLEGQDVALDALERRPPRRVAPTPRNRRRIERLESWLSRIRRSA